MLTTKMSKITPRGWVSHWRILKISSGEIVEWKNLKNDYWNWFDDNITLLEIGSTISLDRLIHPALNEDENFYKCLMWWHVAWQQVTHCTYSRLPRWQNKWKWGRPRGRGRSLGTPCWSQRGWSCTRACRACPWHYLGIERETGDISHVSSWPGVFLQYNREHPIFCTHSRIRSRVFYQSFASFSPSRYD